MKKTRIFLILTPLIIGILIYLMYRSKNLYYYRVMHSLNISGHVEAARTIAKYYRKLFPTWAIYSLPDGLWLFSTGAAFLINRSGYFFNLIWFTMIYLITTFVEILQGYFGGHGTKLGTYDRNDMYFFTVAYFLILIIFNGFGFSAAIGSNFARVFE